MYFEKVMLMKILKNSILVPSISITTGIIAYLILSGTFFPSFNPLGGIVDASGYGSFSYVTNMLNYETSEVSYNMEDMYNRTHLYDFSGKGHFGRIEGSLESEIGFYGQSLRWPGGQVLVEDLDIVDMSFTIEAWIYPTSNDSIALTGCETIYPFIFKAQNGSMRYQYSGGPSVLYSNQPVELNAWTHVALVYNASSGVAKWYLNGNEHGSKLIDTVRDWDGQWAIGRMRTPYAWTYEWRGKIDEFRIYKGRALKQSEIQEDLETSIVHKLTLTGLTPYSDEAELWYPNGEFAEAHMLEETADENGLVEFSVYTFSGRSTSYNGVLKVHRSGRTYVSPVTEFFWEDIYHFSVHAPITETMIAAFTAGLIMTVPPVLMIIQRHTRKHRESS